MKLIEFGTGSLVRYTTREGFNNLFPITFELYPNSSLQVLVGFSIKEEGVDYEVVPNNGNYVVKFKEDLKVGLDVTLRRVTKATGVPHTYQYTGNAQGGAEFSAKTIDENFEYTSRIVGEISDYNKVSSDMLEQAFGDSSDLVGIATEARDTANEAKVIAEGVDTKVEVVGNRVAEIEANSASKQYVDEAIDAIPEPDLTPYRKKDDLSYEDGSLLTNKDIISNWDQASDENVFSAEFIKKTSNKVDIRIFEAKFDGVSNDTQAWVEAIAYCKAEGATLTLPKGVTVVDPDVIDPLGVSMEGVAGGYFNRSGSVIEATQKTGSIFKQSDFGAGNITFTWSNILFRKCNDAFDLGYAVNCSFNNIFLEDSSGSFRLGRPSVLGSLWCSFRNCQTNTDGAGLILDGSVMANSNYFEACAFKGKLPSRVHASGGYGAIGNTFVATEFFGGGVGLEFGSNRNTNLISCYFESKDHSISITDITRGLNLTNPIFSVHESVDGSPPTYIKHSAGIIDISITNPIVYVTDKETTKGMSLFRSYADASVRRVSVTNPIVNVSGGTEQSLDFKLVRGVSISKLLGGFKETVSTSETGLKCDLIYMCGELTIVRGRVDILEHSKVGLFEVNLQGTYSDPAHNIVGDCLVRISGSESAMHCRINSGRNRLYITKPNGQNLQWGDLAAGDFMFINVQLT